MRNSEDLLSERASGPLRGPEMPHRPGVPGRMPEPRMLRSSLSLDFSGRQQLARYMPTGHSMASRLPGGHASQATVLSMQRDRVGDWATRRGRAVPGPDGSRKRRISFDDVVVVLCFLALIGIVVVGGVVMLLAWVAASLPASPRIACPEFDGCEVPGPDDNPALLVDEHWTDGPILTR